MRVSEIGRCGADEVAGFRLASCVLRDVDETTYTGGTMGADPPVIWAQERLIGRVLYTARPLLEPIQGHWFGPEALVFDVHPARIRTLSKIPNEMTVQTTSQ